MGREPNIEDESSSGNINVLELIPLWLGLHRFAHAWWDTHVVCYTDSSIVKSCFQREIGEFRRDPGPRRGKWQFKFKAGRVQMCEGLGDYPQATTKFVGI